MAGLAQFLLVNLLLVAHSAPTRFKLQLPEKFVTSDLSGNEILGWMGDRRSCAEILSKASDRLTAMMQSESCFSLEKFASEPDQHDTTNGSEVTYRSRNGVDYPFPSFSLNLPLERHKIAYPCKDRHGWARKRGNDERPCHLHFECDIIIV